MTEERKVYMKHWRLKNKDHIKKVRHKYYKSHKEIENKHTRKYYRLHSEHIKKLVVAKLNMCPWMKSYKWARSRCMNPNNNRYKNYGGRGIKFLLTKEEIKTLWFRDKAYKMKKPSIDRIDNDGNYEFNNCQFMEIVDNIAKRTKERIKMRELK